MFETGICNICKGKRNFYRLQRCACCEKIFCTDCIIWFWGIPFEDYGIHDLLGPESPVCSVCSKKVNRTEALIKKLGHDQEKILIEKFKKCCKEH